MKHCPGCQSLRVASAVVWLPFRSYRRGIRNAAGASRAGTPMLGMPFAVVDVLRTVRLGSLISPIATLSNIQCPSLWVCRHRLLEPDLC